MGELRCTWVFFRIGIHGKQGGGTTMLSPAGRAIVVCLAAARLVIALSIAYQGAWFLLYSENLKDIVLNSLALGFIYDIDENLFAAFVPLTRQKDVADSLWYFSKEGAVENASDQDATALLAFC